MIPTQRAAGMAGIVAGAGLAFEFALFMASGWTPETFADPASALAFFESAGTTLRAAAVVGVVNLGFTALFLAGLAGALRVAAPTRAATVLYLGLVGVAGHALVPLGLWLGPGTFLDLHSQRPELALSAWSGFSAFLDAAGGVGALFAGVAVAAAGSAMFVIRQTRAPLALVGLLGGGASVLTVLGPDTPVEAATAALYMPALILIIVFRLWAGLRLWRDPSWTSRRGSH